jgi:hypothetical protein
MVLMCIHMHGVLRASTQPLELEGETLKASTLGAVSVWPVKARGVEHNPPMGTRTVE